ncbi:MAG: hypothetical protein COS99_01390 [Candidatus Omnitrophica bacterium CG07_land_8_20_14_0_80_42_15]|uniref:Class I SAM-dependent methyltransferase n=1 Tax=Candidatus Aquitaenariimonas noxiae TaxID=1974741 RepID=A0A2J0KY29_9BACT|nr:MAG: hypothetical protein COS99_01390 [Candidatus Omnitrophica bacterium CG07_land_8_20_14_0_80_42_15]
MIRNIAKRLIQRILREFGYKIVSCQTREDFLMYLPKNSVGAEIGVFKGLFTKNILPIVRPKELYLIDAWWTRSGEYSTWIDQDTYFGTLKTRETFEIAKRVVEKYDIHKISKFLVGDDLDLLKTFKDKYFDWVYLDTNHKYEHTKAELEILKDKVKDNGRIAGHDWYPDPTHMCYGVYKAVTEFCKKYKYKIMILDHCLQWAIIKEQE